MAAVFSTKVTLQFLGVLTGTEISVDGREVLVRRSVFFE